MEPTTTPRTNPESTKRSALEAVPGKPRIAFLGTGWIGYNRMKAVAESGNAEIVAAADKDPTSLANAAKLAGSCEVCTSFDELLAHKPDGIVIATPNALHAAQAIAALQENIAVFCQKPLGRDLAETRLAIDAARSADRLLQVDYSYRHTQGLKAIRQCIRSGELGLVFAADLVFHNAYGPDKPWYYDREIAGGGCLADLGVHLVDAALWCLDFPEIVSVAGRLYRNGRPVAAAGSESEDFATAEISLDGSVEIRIGCSWGAHAGKDAQISARFWGSEGAAHWENVNGSFYDFSTWKFRGTSARSIPSPTDQWGSGAILEWVGRLAEGGRYDPAIEETANVALVLDRIYGRSPAGAGAL